MKYCVRIYKVVGFQEFDLNEKSGAIARKQAGKLAKSGKWLEADCETLAISTKVKENEEDV